MCNTKLLPKFYNAKEIESRWYNLWQKNKLFTPKSSDSLPKKNPLKKPYVIMMPPPNITGILHNGHALFVTIEDVLARYHRMHCKNVLWLPGIDHAGIATETVVERELLNKNGQSKKNIGRKQFLKKIIQWKDKNGTRIIEQLKTLGASADWSRCRFTLDETCSKAVKEAFVRMWNDGLIYRGERLVNWDPKTNTALSNEEVDHKIQKSKLYFFAYKVRNKKNLEIIVATTRPETILGDTAVAVNPKDKRYINFINKELEHPFFKKRTIKVIADKYVDMKFGSGAVKITPAHDLNDFLMAKRHNLKIINIFTHEAKINKNGGKYIGLDRFAARKQIILDLKKNKLFRHTETIEHSVSISQRSHANIEPMLLKQYFIKTKKLAKAVLKVVENNETKIIPENFYKIWNNFLLNIEDWCISRQIWWGHKIPIFYNIKKMKQIILEDAKKKKCQTVALKALENKKKISEVLKLALIDLDDNLVKLFSKASTKDLTESGKSKTYYQEEDVLDTWFSSGLWPFSTLGWPNKTDDLKAFYPGNVLETGSDILFFWVARMMMLSIYFMGETPFKDIILHPIIRDSYGKKMSKSLGNVIDPIDVIFGITLKDLLTKIKTYPVPNNLLPKIINNIKKDYPNGIQPSGADALRFSLAILSNQGQSICLSIPRINGYRAFLNKIWNATRFALIRVKTNLIKPISNIKNLSLQERWILSKIQFLNNKVQSDIENYNFSKAAESIYHFFWTEFCDWYLEFAKINLSNNASIEQKEQTSSVIIEILDISCRLLHPFCPYISEEIWQLLPLKEKRWKKLNIKFCAIAPFPKKETSLIDNVAENKISLIKKIISMIRNVKQESNLSQKKYVQIIVLVENSENIKLLNNFKIIIKKISYISLLKIELRAKVLKLKNSTIKSSTEFDVILPLEGLTNKETEKIKLKKDLNKIAKEMLTLSSRLNNVNFIKYANKEIVEQNSKRFKYLKTMKISTKERLLQI